MFHTSTQREHWLCDSAEELGEKRRAAHDRAVAAVKAAYAAAAGEGGGAEEALDFVTYEEAQRIVQHYASRVPEFAARFHPKLPDRVVATATVYLKRYYIEGTVLEHEPSLIFALAIFFACKAEDQVISLSDFCRVGKLPGGTGAFIKAHELDFVERLKFHVVVHTPFRALRGFFIDASTFLAGAGLPDGLFDKATGVLRRWIQTDVLLTHPPSQVALAALLHATPADRRPDLQRYVKSKLGGAGDAGAARLQRALDVIPAAAAEGPVGPTPPAEHQRLKEKLKACRNPLFDPASAIAKRRAEAAEVEREAKRQKRDEEWKQKQEAQLASILGSAPPPV
mmetsp:Transcript_28118/g.84041  ORF Transcript_28118/g.84041 Transcript_28118/m.84041 type:complete len:339 (+) Transcript_28118:395-1411(+)